MIQIISAQWGGWGGYTYSPDQLFNNEWFIFVMIALVFFAVIFYTVNRAFRNPAVSATIALALSLLIALTFSRRGYLYDYAGGELGSWIVIFVFLLSMVFLMVFLYEGVGPFGPFLGGIGIWFILVNADPYRYLPSELLSSSLFSNLYGFTSNAFGSILLLIIMLIISALISYSIRRNSHYRSRYGPPGSWYNI